MIGKKMKVLPQAIAAVSSACFNFDMREMFVPELNMNGVFPTAYKSTFYWIKKKTW